MPTHFHDGQDVGRTGVRLHNSNHSCLGARGNGSTGSKVWKSYFGKYLLTS